MSCRKSKLGKNEGARIVEAVIAIPLGFKKLAPA